MLSPLHGGVDRNLDSKEGKFIITGRPFTGAWIETSSETRLSNSFRRRPFTGAWIETRSGAQGYERWEVAPSRGRGSKLPKYWHTQIYQGCRPFTGAWIETLPMGYAVTYDQSPLHGGVDRNVNVGHEPVLPNVAPSRGRGSKLNRTKEKRYTAESRPFTGAWIETTMALWGDSIEDGRPFTGAWIETL